MSGFTTVMPYQGHYAVVVSPSQPTEAGAPAIPPTTILLSRDGLLGLLHEGEKALMVGEGEALCLTFATVAATLGREETCFASWHWPEVLDMARDAWGLSPEELPTEAVQSAIIVPADYPLDVPGASVPDRDPPGVSEVGLAAPESPEAGV